MGNFVLVLLSLILTTPSSEQIGSVTPIKNAGGGEGG
jgi:hypothetical protein